LDHFNSIELCFLFMLVWYRFIKWLSCCEWTWPKLLAPLRELNEELKGEIRLLDYLIRPRDDSKENLHVERMKE